MNKNEIRDEMRAKRRAVSSERRVQVSHAISQKLLKLAEGAKLVCCYQALKTEIDLQEFIDWCPCEVVFPQKRGDDYVVERAEEVDFWVCPGLAFTLAGDRVGFGGGWYDRFLSKAKPTAKVYGVAYDFQIVDKLPREAHDRRLNGVVWLEEKINRT